MPTLESLQAKIAKLQAQAEALLKKDSTAAIVKIRDIMAKHGLTTAAIQAHVGGAKKRGRKPGVKAAVKASVSAAKYRDPKTGATWTGHGRAPSWIGGAKNRSKFLVEGNAVAASAPAAKKAAKVGNYVRGPQPALYAAPKTGATWSGRGRAPVWIAGAKDRSKFLIAGNAEATVAATAVVVGKSNAAVEKASKTVGVGAGKGQPRGPQAAKYRDPKSGATWSGRGPAPAWLSGAKDRSKFLIDGESTAADAKPVVTKAAAKKAPTAKKTAAKKAVSAKVPAKKAPRKSVAVAVPAPLVPVESGAESTT